jgi:RHS repeat-associated protein
MVHARGAEVVGSFGYTFDPLTGQLTSTTSSGVPSAGIESYAYTPLQQIEQVTGGTSPGSFDYDDAHNLVTRADGATLSYDASRQLERVTPTVGAATDFAYNALGERATETTAGVTTSYGYDQVGRLTSFEPAAGAAAQYTYDADGVRQSKQVAGTTSHMTWTTGGLPLLLDDDEFAYVYGPGGMPLHEIATDNTARYLLADQLGSTRIVADSTGAAVGSTTYDTWGAPTTTGSVSRLGYAGQYTDAESGLVYLRARYYEPTTAQFLTRDPLERISRDPYGYAAGNPITSSDPTGMLPDWLPSASEIAETSAGIGDAMSFGAF